VQSCLSCHADRHSLAFKASPHYALWQKETKGELPPGSGVSCATCHMPRIKFDVSDWMSRIMVEHNQSAVQSPNSKMIRPSCGHCHGQGFSMDALADEALIERNFKGRTQVHVDSMDLAREDKKRRDAESGDSDTSMFGF
jgi:formate-dependent nitrite reductase cytochrome c552 subunit